MWGGDEINKDMTNQPTNHTINTPTTQLKYYICWYAVRFLDLILQRIFFSKDWNELMGCEILIQISIRFFVITLRLLIPTYI